MSAAARIASRVLPTPPGPARLTRRASVSFFLISASSRRRPMKLVASAGRLPECRAGLAISGIKTAALLVPVHQVPTQDAHPLGRQIGNSTDAGPAGAFLA